MAEGLKPSGFNTLLPILKAFRSHFTMSIPVNTGPRVLNFCIKTAKFVFEQIKAEYLKTLKICQMS